MCDIDYDDGEHCAMWEERKVGKAKKDHKCSCCGGAIAKGDSYVTHFSIFGNEPWHEKKCLPCDQIVQDFKKEHDGQSGIPSYIPELLHHCIDEEGADSEAGKKWQAALDEMTRRFDATKQATT